MNQPPRFRADRLWRHLADAQDAAIGDRPPSQAVVQVVVQSVARSLTARVEAHRQRRVRRVGVIALSLGSVVAAVALLAFQKPLRNTFGLGGTFEAVDQSVVQSLEQSLVADARSDLPLQFLDGSTVIFRAGSAGHMRRLKDTGAEIVLDRGTLEAHVIHAATTLWLVHAGPYRVRVTGTRFAMTWASENLEVALYEGAVVVDGALLGAGVPLRAGQRLKIKSGVVLIEPFNAVAIDDSVVPASPIVLAPEIVAASPRGPRSFHRQLAPDDEWLTLAERGAYSEALSVARGLGWGALCRRLDAHRLLTLGDVARYSGAHAQSRRAFESLVTRFPDDRLAADAVFSLGRLAFESRRPDEATRWFRRYVADWPRGPLADQAAGRLVECAIRMDDRDAARSAARAYLARAPGGPQAGLARDVLDHPADGPP